MCSLWKKLLIMSICTGVPLFTFGQGALRIKNLELSPKPAGSSADAVQLQTSRSYRVVVTIERGGAAEPQFPTFTVRTECVRPGGVRLLLGEGRIGVTVHSTSVLYAAYDIFPSSAGQGSCVLRTIVNVDGEVQKPAGSPADLVWDRRAEIVAG